MIFQLYKTTALIKYILALDTGVKQGEKLSSRYTDINMCKLSVSRTCHL